MSLQKGNVNQLAPVGKIQDGTEETDHEDNTKDDTESSTSF